MRFNTNHPIFIIFMFSHYNICHYLDIPTIHAANGRLSSCVFSCSVNQIHYMKLSIHYKISFIYPGTSSYHQPLLMLRLRKKVTFVCFNLISESCMLLRSSGDSTTQDKATSIMGINRQFSSSCLVSLSCIPSEEASSIVVLMSRLSITAWAWWGKWSRTHFMRLISPPKLCSRGLFPVIISRSITP